MNNQAAPQIYFQEVQRFREPWIWTFLISTTFLTIGIAIWLITWPIDPGEEGVEPLALNIRIYIAVAILASDGLILWLMWVTKLQTEVSSNGLFLQFFPFHRKVRNLDLNAAVAVTPVEYQPLQQYGGWGIRKVRFGTAYNISGNQGVRIDYDNECHILIGTQRPFELNDAIHAVWTPPEGYESPYVDDTDLEADGDEDYEAYDEDAEAQDSPD